MSGCDRHSRQRRRPRRTATTAPECWLSVALLACVECTATATTAAATTATLPLCCSTARKSERASDAMLRVRACAGERASSRMNARAMWRSLPCIMSV